VEHDSDVVDLEDVDADDTGRPMAKKDLKPPLPKKESCRAHRPPPRIPRTSSLIVVVVAPMAPAVSR
jgi:hypothetical protein